MKRTLFAIVIMMICSAIGSWLLPWWIVAAVCFVVALNFGLQPGSSFLAGFAAIFLLWLSIALFRDYNNEHILSTRMAELFHLKNPFLFIIVAALVGGLAGGFSAWSGALMKKMVKR